RCPYRSRRSCYDSEFCEIRPITGLLHVIQKSIKLRADNIRPYIKLRILAHLSCRGGYQPPVFLLKNETFSRLDVY
ncbi:MAG: hypothetical protein ACI4J6_08800, partial [Oscillospiraceae bacterium]